MKSKKNSAAGSVMAVLITALALVLAWKMILPGYVTNKSESARLDKLIVAAQDKKDSLDKAKSDLSSMDATYRAITIAVPGDADEPNTISELEAIALKSQIAIPAITIAAVDPATLSGAASGNPDELVATQAGVPVEISVTVNGTFEQLSSLITSLEKSVKFMNIKNLSFSVGEGGILGLSMTIESYARATAFPAAVAE